MKSREIMPDIMLLLYQHPGDQQRRRHISAYNFMRLQPWRESDFTKTFQGSNCLPASKLIDRARMIGDGNLNAIASTF